GQGGEQGGSGGQGGSSCGSDRGFCFAYGPERSAALGGGCAGRCLGRGVGRACRSTCLSRRDRRVQGRVDGIGGKDSGTGGAKDGLLRPLRGREGGSRGTGHRRGAPGGGVCRRVSPERGPRRACV